MRNFFTEGLIGFRYGKKGLFSKPSTVEFNWKLGDKELKKSDEEIAGKGNTENLKFDVKIKL